MSLSHETRQVPPGESPVHVTVPGTTGLDAIQGSALALLDLPPLPAIAIKALRMVSSSETRLRELHNLLAADQAFSIEILKIVNSPLYGIRVEITSLMQAMMLLGFERVRGLLLTIGMRAFVSGLFSVAGVRACWRHSLASALIAEEIAQASGMDKDVAYTGGLIHDIGRLALVVLRPQQYSDLVESSRELPCDPQEEERRRFGMDHCEAGRSLVVAWNLPGQFIELAAEHHAGRADGAAEFALLDVVRVSCAMSGIIGFEVVRSRTRPGYRDLVEQLPSEARQQFSPEAESLAQRITAKVDSMEAL